MVRRKLEIKRIERHSARHTTFTKWRHRLEKTATKFFEGSSSEAIMITFSDAGNCFVLAHPHIDVVMNRYDSEPSSGLSTEPGAVGSSLSSDVVAEPGVGGSCPSADGIAEEDAAAMETETEAQKRIEKAVENGRWNEAVEDLGLEELDEIYEAMEIIKRELAARGREIAATAKKSPDGGASVGDSTSA